MKRPCSERLSKALLIKNMTQTELCKKTGIPKSAMSQYTKGNFEPKQDRIYLIAKALNINEAWLMGYDVPMERNNDISSTIEKSSAENGKGLDKNTVVIVGRDGRRIEKKLSDEQIKALEMMVEQLPPFEL